MSVLRDATGAQAALIAGLVDFRGRRVLEVGCGEGELTGSYAGEAASVLGIDPNAERVAAARATTPAHLRERVSFEVADAVTAEFAPGRFDLIYFTWSL